MPLVLHLADGARVIVCGEYCRGRFEERRGARAAFIEATYEFYQVACCHCYWCGDLIAAAKGECLLHGHDCPLTLWERTTVAREFAYVAAVLLGGEVPEDLWQRAEATYVAHPYLTGGAVAHRLISERW